MKRLSDRAIGWAAIVIGLGTVLAPVATATSAASSAITVALGAATALYGGRAAAGRRRGEGHWPLVAIGLALVLSPWLAGFAVERAAWVVSTAGLALLAIAPRTPIPWRSSLTEMTSPQATPRPHRRPVMRGIASQ
jgi:hypothetical protein